MEEKKRIEDSDKVISSMRSIHMIPMDVVNGFEVRPGMYEVNGATAIPCGVNFTVQSYWATSCELLLFRRLEEEPYAVIPFPGHYKVGKVYSMIVFGLDIEHFEYAYRLHGPDDRRKSLFVDKSKYLLDIYAKAVTGQRDWGVRSRDSNSYRARVVKDDFDWGTSRQPLIPMEDLVIYEMHVRGFTRHGSSGVEYPGTFKGLQEKIAYLKDLGVNAVELMPVFEFDEMKDYREIDGKIVMDYWGYNTVSFFAPNTGYTAEVEHNHEGTELKKLIKELNENGIECFLDVVFNHTAEGNEMGSCFSFKGFDNDIYYMLTPDGHYFNFSGCGNTLNCNHPMVQTMITECLRYWTTAYHVDGFRFDLATILGRNEDGSPMSNPPLLKNLAFDPILGNVKLIAEAWDAGGLYQVGSFPAWNRWAEWNGKYRDDMRDFLKGNYGMSNVAGKRITGSKDLYDPARRGNNASVNFITCHDGFPLWDLYTYNTKHNEANGWNNTDGTDDNRSWNCGVEGETDNVEILTLRRRLIKNAAAVLMMSRGTPMFLAGDEFGNTQNGNNNAYCQDNEISWLDWNRLEENKDIYEFFRYMIRFRKNHPVVRKDMGRCFLGFPEVQVTEANEWCKTLRVMYAGRKEQDDGDDIVCLAVNVFWEEQEFSLPALPPGTNWYVAVDTGNQYLPNGFAKEEDMVLASGGKVRMVPRSVAVFVVK